jgi:hypothetical protein
VSPSAGDVFVGTTAPAVTLPLTSRSSNPKPVMPAVNPYAADVFIARTAARTSGPNLTGEAVGIGNVAQDNASIEGKANGKVKGPRGLEVSFGASARAEVRTDVESEDGDTTYPVTRDVSVTVKGKVDAGVVGFGAEHTEGVETTYQVRMTDEDYERLVNGEMPPPDPVHPETWPAGTSIVMNSADYENTGFSASYKRIGIDTNTRTEEGTSVMIEAGGPGLITVTAGPTEAVENSFKLGLSLGVASAHIGNTTELESFKLNTATFDLYSKRGAAAYAVRSDPSTARWSSARAR